MKKVLKYISALKVAIWKPNIPSWPKFDALDDGAILDSYIFDQSNQISVTKISENMLINQTYAKCISKTIVGIKTKKDQFNEDLIIYKMKLNSTVTFLILEWILTNIESTYFLKLYESVRIDKRILKN